MYKETIKHFNMFVIKMNHFYAIMFLKYHQKLFMNRSTGQADQSSLKN